MLDSADLYTSWEVFPLSVEIPDPENQGKKKPLTFGVCHVSYEVRRYSNLRNLGSSGSYQVRCTQRVIIANMNAPAKLLALGSPSGFEDYPAIIINQIRLDSAKAEIVTYQPRTLNSSTTTSRSAEQVGGTSANRQLTSGSANSQSNSYGASVSIGFFGADPTGSLSLNYEQSSGSEQSRSASAGDETHSSRSSSSGESMSVKDWACYAYVGVASAGDTPDLTWVWGQEHPWNVLQYRGEVKSQSKKDGTKVEYRDLPAFVKALMLEDGQLLPPSQLSQFGVDFTMKGLWIVSPPDGRAAFSHTISYYTASHWLNEGDANLHAAVENYTDSPLTLRPEKPLDLCRLGLDPILSSDEAPVAIIGFVPRQFLVAPAPAKADALAPVPFKIVSASNNLFVEDTTAFAADRFTSADVGAGFDASQTALTATFTEHCRSLTVTLCFKVVDTGTAYKLFMKHWKASDNGVLLSISINPDKKNRPVTEDPIEVYVDAQEAQGGEGNLTTISLRDLGYGSVDYHDYLQLGLNTIVITATPIKPAVVACKYHLRAISVEKS